MRCIRVLPLLCLAAILSFAAVGCIVVLTPDGIESWDDYDGDGCPMCRDRDYDDDDDDDDYDEDEHDEGEGRHDHDGDRDR